MLKRAESLLARFDKIGEIKLNSTTKEILEWAYCIIIALVLAMLFRYFIGTPTIVKQVKAMVKQMGKNYKEASR